MADINNTFTINAAQAIQTLDRLNTSLNNVNGSLRRFQALSNQRFGAGINQATASLQNLSRQGQQSLNTLNNGLQRSQSQARGLGLSFQDITRIIGSQILFSAITGLTRGFSESADAARDFELQLLRIQAIAR